MRLPRLLPHGSPLRNLVRRLFIDVQPQPHLRQNFRKLDDVPENVNLEEPEIGDTFAGRLTIARRYVVPWLDRARALAGCKILEIGCGTGASTVAFAEQGCSVTAVDIDVESIESAKKRCQQLGLEVEFVVSNAVDVATALKGRKFDFIIFYASIEHMTHEERIAAIGSTWEMLSPGDFWCITGTPNRLWNYDFHTAYLPFYFWLPDDLAFAYARRSKRKGFRELYDEMSEEKMHHFLRRGRGVSFHEFDLAIRPVQTLDIVSSMGPELRDLRLINKLRWRFTDAYAHEKTMRRIAPDIHEGFFQSLLNVLIRKDANPPNH